MASLAAYARTMTCLRTQLTIFRQSIIAIAGAFLPGWRTNAYALTFSLRTSSLPASAAASNCCAAAEASESSSRVRFTMLLCCLALSAFDAQSAVRLQHKCHRIETMGPTGCSVLRRCHE